MSGPQAAHFEATLTVGKLVPVPRHHHGLALQKEENFLVVAMAVNADPAIVLEEVQIGIIHSEKFLGALLPRPASHGVELPRLDHPSEVVAVRKTEVVRHQVTVMEK